MSTTLYESLSLQVTRFYGGEDRGTCIQIDVDGHGAVQLTRDDAAKLATVLAPRCETCSHWDRKYELEPNHRLCLAKKLESDDRDGVKVVVVTEYAKFLATGPDFGCVHHQARAE